MKKTVLSVLLGVAVLAASLTSCGQPTVPDINETTFDAADTETEGADTRPEIDSTETSCTLDATETESVSETKTDVPSTVEVNAVYPTPMEVLAGTEYVDLSQVALSDEVYEYAHLLEESGATLDEDGVPVTACLRELTEFSYGAEEGYILTVRADGVTVEAQTPRGMYYAIVTLCQLMEDGVCPSVTVKDAPRNPLRGVIEGFYGTPWTHEYRKDLFAFMGENKMNAYIYAPKSDAKHREQWRELYSGDELDVMEDLIASAEGNYVKFIYAISPGGDIDLGDGYEADFAKLVAKCQQIYDLGVRDFAIFLDDIPTLDAEGHAKLLNDFQTQFVATHEGMSHLIAITTEYCDPFLTDYTDTIAPLIHEDVVLMWTGNGVVPDAITNASLRRIIRIYDRPVLIWWNYPVNDVLVNNLYMGACEGLESALYESITGLTANPMNQGYASMVPLFTTGDYLWNPTAYDADASLKAACDVLMPDAAEALCHFIGMTCASPMNRQIDSVELRALLNRFNRANTAENRQALQAYFEDMIRHADAILACENQAMVAEMEDWIAKYRAFGEMGLAYVEMENAYAEGKGPEDLLPLLGRYMSAKQGIAENARLVSDAVLTPFLSNCPQRMNVMLGQSEEVQGTPAATPSVSTSLPTYENYLPSLMEDGDPDTFFWAGRGGQNGDYIQLDLGAVTAVSHVTFKAGAASHTADYIYHGELRYSSDGQSWTAICDVNSRDTEVDVNVRARYLRVVVTADQANWITVSEFSAEAEDRVPAELQLDENFVSRSQLLTLLDGYYTSCFALGDPRAEGHTLYVTVGDGGAVSISALALPEGGVTVGIKAANGYESELDLLGYHTEIQAPAGAVIAIPLGHGLALAEIRR